MAIEVMAKLSVDASGADAAIDSIAKKEKELENAKAKIAVDTTEAESKLEGLKEKAKDALGGLGAGIAVGAGLAGIDQMIDKYKELAKSNSDLKIAIAGTGQSQEAQQEIFKQSQEEVDTLSQKYHVHEEAVRSVETAIVGIGGVTGAAKGKLTEIGLAFEQLNIPAKALKGVIAGANDPDSQQALDALQKKIGNLGPAFTNATTPAEKMDALYKRLQGTLGGMANLDPQLAAMEQFDETTKKMEASGGQLIVGFLSPVLPILTGLAGVMTSDVVPAISSVSDFINNNKVAVAVLAGGVGILTLALNANAVSTTAVTIAEKARAVATGVVTGAQWLLNAAMTANPIGLVIGAVVALAAGAVLLYNNVKPVHDAFDAIWTVLKGVAAFIGAFVSTEIASLIKAFQGVGSVLHGIVTLNFDEVKKGVTDVGSAVGSYATAGVAGVGAFKKSIDDSAKSLTDQKGKAKEAGDAGVDAAQAAAQAQADYQKAIEDANNAFDAQTKFAKAALDDAKTTYERQAEYVATGYANGQKLSDAQIAAYAAANVKLKAQAKDTQDELKRIAKEGQEFDGTEPKKKKGNENLLAEAKTLAEEKAKELETTLKLQAAERGVAYSSSDELAVEKEKIAVFNGQVDKLKLMTAEKGKYKEKTTLEQNVNTTQELTLEVKVHVDAEKVKEEFNKSISDLTKKKIEIGVLPKDEGFKLIDGEIDEIMQKMVALRANQIVNPNDLTIASKLNETEAQLIDLEHQRHDLGIQLDTDLAKAKIANMKDGTSKTVAELTLQFETDTQFARDAAAQGVQLTETQLLQKSALEAKYYADLAKLQQKNETDELKLETIGVNSAIALLQTELNAKQKFDELAYESKKLSLDKEQTANLAAYQKGTISAQEYNLKIAQLTQQRTDLETQKVQARWANEEKLAEQGYKAISDDLTKYIQAEIQAEVLRAAGNKVGADSEEAKANATMLGSVANTISGFTATIPIIGPVLGIAAGIALMEGFKGLEHLLGFETGGIGVVGENGPEIMGPTKDFSQMATQLVTSTARAVSQSMNGQNGSSRGSKHQFNVRVTGQTKAAGRDLQTVFNNEGLARQNESLLHTN
jgi:hypothetical protein